jgi:large subunit ribosomal protein L15e
MSMYKYLRDLWKAPKKNLGDAYKQHLIEWRKEPVTIRILKPTRIDRARALGYKAKTGFVIVRQRVDRRRRKRPEIDGGRRPKHNRSLQVVNKNYQHIAEERANKKFKNCEVLGSYYLAEDGQHKWYEIILVDPDASQIKADKGLNWIGKNNQTGRVYRGLTSAGRKARGLNNKGKGAEKVRPSKAANLRRRTK